MRREGIITILMLGGGKRVSMARHIKDAARHRGLPARIVGYELSADVPLACEAEAIVCGLRWDDRDILGSLHAVVEEYKIDVMLAMIDGAVAVASRYSRDYGDVFVPIGTPDAVGAVIDHVQAAAVYEAACLPIPDTWHGECPPPYPMVAKGRSRALHEPTRLLHNDADMHTLHPLGDYLIQHYIGRCEEYSVDCYVSMSTGDVLCLSPRLRQEMAGGEVMRTITVDDLDLEQLTREVLTVTGLRGCVTVQLLRDLSLPQHPAALVEVLPRLGSGAGATIAAGADLAGLILDEARGLLPLAIKAVPGVEVARYLTEVPFFPPGFHHDA